MAGPHETITTNSDWRDRLGIGLSLLCLVHCILTPVLLALLPVGAALGFWEHGFHQVFLLIVPFVALIAFIPGWRRHGDARIWILGVLGIALLALGVAVAEFFGHGVGAGGVAWAPLAAELGFTIAGGACLIRAHLLNRELCACCGEHDHAVSKMRLASRLDRSGH